MNRAWILVPLALLAGCGDSKLSPHAGTYKLDGAASVTATEQELQTVTAGQEAAVAEQTRTQIAPMLEQLKDGEFDLTLGGDGKFSTHIDLFDKHDHPSGTWELDDDKVTLHYQDGRKYSGKLTGDTLRLTNADQGGQVIVFVLKRS